MGQQTLKLLLFGIFLELATLSPAQYVPKATLYSALVGSGSFVNIPAGNEPISNLEALGFNNRAKSVCLMGTWLFYDDINFNSAGNGGMEYIFEPEEICVNFQSLGGHVSSLRAAGLPHDYRQDGITLYADIYFQNEQEFGVNELRHLLLYGRVASIVITGSSHWTIYDEPEFGGKGICLQVSPNLEYPPHFIPDTVLLNPTVPRGSIASVRKGCYSKTIVKLKSPAPSRSRVSTAAVTTSYEQRKDTFENSNPKHFVIPFFSN